MPTIKKLQRCSTRGWSQGMYITFDSATRMRQNSLWLWNPEETSPEIQSSSTSDPIIGHMNVSDKKHLKETIKKVTLSCDIWKCLAPKSIWHNRRSLSHSYSASISILYLHRLHNSGRWQSAWFHVYMYCLMQWGLSTICLAGII